MENKENRKMSAQSNRRLRKTMYRSLLNNLDDIVKCEDLGLNTVQKLGDIVSEANNVHDLCNPEERVKCANEMLLDTMVLSNTTSLLTLCTKALNLSTTTYEPTEFASNLIKAIKPIDEDELRSYDLLELLKDAREIIPETLKTSYLYGACDFTQLPQRKEPKRRENRDAQEKVQKKELIQVVANNEKDESEDIVLYLHKILQKEYEDNGRKPINYYDFVVDTSDFEQTVNNIFYCSFVIRDGKAQMMIEDGTPMILPVHKKDLKTFRREGGNNVQFISSIDMDFWKKFTKEGLLQRHRQRSKN